MINPHHLNMFRCKQKFTFMKEDFREAMSLIQNNWQLPVFLLSYCTHVSLVTTTLAMLKPILHMYMQVFRVRSVQIKLHVHVHVLYMYLHDVCVY